MADYDLVVRGGNVADGTGAAIKEADIAVKDGRIAAVGKVSGQGAEEIGAKGLLVTPGFVDIHTHLDKGHILPRAHNPDGTFPGALAAVEADRDANWSADDVRARMDFAIRCAYAHGTALIRTHIDSVPPQFPASWPVFSEMREKWAGKVELQGVGLTPIDRYLDAAFSERLANTIVEHRGVLGGVKFTKVFVNSDLALGGNIAPSVIGYAGAFYQWPDNWKLTGRFGVQSFGGAHVGNLIQLPSFTQPILRVDLDRMDDNDNRLFGISFEAAWTPAPVIQLTLRTPIYAVRN